MSKEFLTMDDFNIRGKTVLLRVDINSPINPLTGAILDDTRIQNHIKTIRDLSESKVVLLAHQSRPGKRDFTNMEKHAKQVTKRLGKHVVYIDDFFGSKAKNKIKSMKTGDVILLENARFYAEEHILKGKDFKTQSESHMVSQLYRLANFYINDAFAAAHRAQPSLTGFTEVLPSLAGRLMEKEITMMETAMHSKERPTVAILGGIKVFDTLKVMSNMLKNDMVDKVLTTGVVANIFLLARGHDLGAPNTSFLQKEVGSYDELTEQAKGLDNEYKDRIDTPSDLVLNDNGNRKGISVKDLPADLLINDIGLDTAVNYRKQILAAKNIILNGPAGVFEIEEFAVGTTIIYNAIAESEGFSVIGGGETVAAARNLNLGDKVNHISTGGGACISFLAGQSMPAIEALKHSKELYDKGHYKC
jgi:phosphoglycerate kinase